MNLDKHLYAKDGKKSPFPILEEEALRFISVVENEVKQSHEKQEIATAINRPRGDKDAVIPCTDRESHHFLSLRME